MGSVRKADMAQRGAGTVVTPHKATYIPAHLNPGYGGFLPELRHQYGETYGRATNRHFHIQRARNVALLAPHQSKNVPYERFPSPYAPMIRRCGPPGEGPYLNKVPASNESKVSSQNYGRNSVILARSLNRDRIEKLDRMMQQCQEHRGAYKDISGKTPAVKFFVIPKEFGDRCVGNHYSQRSTVADTSSTYYSRSMPSKYYQSSNRERAMRDLHFEHR